MFHSKSSLRLSRKGIVHASPVQKQHFEQIRKIDAIIEKATVEEIPHPDKCRFQSQVELFKELVMENNDQKELALKIQELELQIEAMYQHEQELKPNQQPTFQQHQLLAKKKLLDSIEANPPPKKQSFVKR